MAISQRKFMTQNFRSSFRNSLLATLKFAQPKAHTARAHTQPQTDSHVQKVLVCRQTENMYVCAGDFINKMRKSDDKRGVYSRMLGRACYCNH